MQIFLWILTAVIGYALGNFNGALLISKTMMHDDVRSHGSGNAGLTNFFRTYGGIQSVLVIVIDMGTATTMVVVDRERCYRGGAIIPGVNLAYGALSSGTSLLPDIAIRPPQKAIGSNTADAMRSGAIFGTAAMLDGMIDRMEAELGEPCTVVATGGLARSIVSCCRHEIVFDDDLLLKGLWVLYQKNK